MSDTEKTGTIPEAVFRRIMTRKNGQIHQDFDEMLAAYKQVHCKSNPETPQGEEYIDYKESRRSFQNKADFFLHFITLLTSVTIGPFDHYL